jgi:hypothetical protein
MENDIPTRVAKGVALLDEKAPGWVGFINLADFSISTTDNCVLGQVYGSYDEGMEELSLRDPELYGFDVETHGMTGILEFRRLQAEWVRVLAVLRQKNQAKEEIHSGAC